MMSLPQLNAYADVALFLLQIAVAVIFLVHALPKLTNPKAMAGSMGGNAAFPFFLGFLEMFSALGLIFGVWVQLSGFFLSIVMLGAIAMKIGKWHVPFTATDKTGWEFDMVLFFVALLFFLGGGSAIRLI